MFLRKKKGGGKLHFRNDIHSLTQCTLQYGKYFHYIIEKYYLNYSYSMVVRSKGRRWFLLLRKVKYPIFLTEAGNLVPKG